ncbi:putative tellurium resistance membrane protein TerC [Winogradskyella eximia]|jgi:predicted tellurium resistance membrane protein TerC|uniref:Putative tellurium resistance membrane protein TerC n=1 Tax=Winogradskyella eximia TaxID=262006 RepID=A0A3D9H7B0_9FLAO|nr:TerC family protein [Winogradskyella eximia]RED45362.1 putative tellurium resistance membrane protein TerC [Winogradskyella eximia]
MLDFLLTSDAIMALLTLTFLEIILGIDNIVFISIAANKLPEHQRGKATNVGLLLAMVQRIILLFFVSFLVGLSEPFYSIKTSWLSVGISWQAIILFAGGLFLIYKSTSEIREKVENPSHDEDQVKSKPIKSLSNAVVQIMVIDFIFSIDSILTAVGMTNGLHPNHNYTLILMIIAVIISIGIMIGFANPIRKFIDTHPSVQILGLAFLILIGFMLITEAAHLSETELFGKTVGAIPKGYLYFAIAFSIFVEFINFKTVKNKKS